MSGKRWAPRSASCTTSYTQYRSLKFTGWPRPPPSAVSAAERPLLSTGSKKSWAKSKTFMSGTDQRFSTLIQYSPPALKAIVKEAFFDKEKINADPIGALLNFSYIMFYLFLTRKFSISRLHFEIPKFIDRVAISTISKIRILILFSAKFRPYRWVRIL